jgi:hypothetical protein
LLIAESNVTRPFRPRRPSRPAPWEQAPGTFAGCPSAFPRRRVRSDYETWLDEGEARLPPTRADLHSRSDEIAARVVAAGVGIEAVIEGTGSRRLENAAELLDPAILTRAFDNDSPGKQRRPPPA